MKSKRQKNKESKPNSVGLRVTFSEKALLSLLHVILVLGMAQFQLQSSVNQEIPPKVFQEQPN